MHMSDALLSPTVGLTMCAVSAGALAVSAARVQRSQLTRQKLPMMAVGGAFVFAAQMINFTIPGTGSSGHIGGGILLATLLGGGPALLALAAVLVVQCLFFADGGLLALGCNIFNMGVLPCLVVYPLVVRPLLCRGLTPRRLSAAALLGAVLGLQLGAFGVVLETQLSGITALPFGTFAALMQPIHLAIGLGEGLVTAGVLCFVARVQPEVLESTQQARPMEKTASVKKIAVLLLCLTAAVAGGLSLFASQNPDGLEWSLFGNEEAGYSANMGLDEEAYGAESAAAEKAAAVQEKTSLLPDYSFAGSDSAAGTSVSGLVGCALVAALAAIISLAGRAARKKSGKKQASAG